MNAVVERVNEPQTTAVVAAMTPMQMLQMAIQQNVDMARLEKLMDLEERWRKAEAKRAYVAAFTKFKKNMPDVVKDLLNKQYGSDYSSLANLVNTTNRALGEYDLNANWRPDQSADGIRVTCVMTHVDGHSEEVTLIGPPDTSGTKNPLQGIKSTLTYLEGATFQAITGVVARSKVLNPDDDGNGAGKKTVEMPEGYEKWNADMTALAEEGTDKLQAAWSKSSDEFRRYVVKHDELWWSATKRKAAKVKVQE
jgi:hypothetical protein